LVNLLFGFNGRINRSQYWLGILGVSVGGTMLLMALSFALMPPPDAPKQAAANAAPMMALLFALFMVAMSWSSLALQVKRFHDRGRSGYWALAPLAPVTMIVMSVAGGIAANDPGQAAGAVMPWFGVLMLINLWLFIDLGLLSGMDGPNKYDHTPSDGGGFKLGGAPGAASTSAASIFGNAEEAMDRAIAEQAHQTQAQAMAPARVATSGGAPSFGRRAAR
jgi:uncharacterized membrane protein YhaH (DUF805 family)